MTLFDYNFPVPCYQTEDIIKYPRQLLQQAADLFQLVGELIPSEFSEAHCKIRDGSFSIIATNSKETSAKIVIYQRGVGRWLVVNNLRWNNGVYIWVRANDESGRAFELAARAPDFNYIWVLSRFTPNCAVSIAPNPNEHFYYFKMEPHDNLTQIAKLLAFCSTL